VPWSSAFASFAGVFDMEVASMGPTVVVIVVKAFGPVVVGFLPGGACGVSDGGGLFDLFGDECG